MSSIDFESTFPVSARDLYAWHARPGAFGRLLPPWQKALLSEGSSRVEEGALLSFRLGKGPFSFDWVAEHTDVRPGYGFTDVQVEGPFRRWVHRHDFRSRGETSSLLRDHVDYTLPGGRLGELVAHSAIAKDLERTFEYRHRILSDDLELHAVYSDQARKKIAITGATGLVGTALTDFLTTGGHEVVKLVRAEDDGVRWDPSHGILEPSRLADVDAIIHLAGEGIALRRWSEAQKKRVFDSRVLGTRNLVQSLSLLDSPPTLISASAVGFYGDQGDRLLTEDDGPGEGFLADVCSRWEQEAVRAREHGCRVVLARCGVVLSPRGGALAKMLPPFRLGAGGRLGSGRQYISWVSIDDVVGAIYHLLMDPGLEGPFNVAAPRPATNAAFTTVLGGVLRRPTVLPMPALMARMAFGEMADEILLSSTRVHSMRLDGSGYSFRHPTLESALRHLLGRS